MTKGTKGTPAPPRILWEDNSLNGRALSGTRVSVNIPATRAIINNKNKGLGVHLFALHIA